MIKTLTFFKLKVNNFQKLKSSYSFKEKDVLFIIIFTLLVSVITFVFLLQMKDMILTSTQTQDYNKQILNF